MGTRWAGRWLAGTAAVGTVAALLAAPAAQAADPVVVTQTFEYTGTARIWTVPAGVTSATFDVYGAEGGRAGGSVFPSSSGGRGGYVRGVLPLVPGQELTIRVGGSPGTTSLGGYNGGGGTAGCCGISIAAGAGGGASDVSLGATPLVVAGGGGGGGGCGVDSGTTASACSVLGGRGGQGGAPLSGGDAGAADTTGRVGGGSGGAPGGPTGPGSGGAGGTGTGADVAPGGPGAAGAGSVGGGGGAGLVSFGALSGDGGGGGGGFTGGGGGGGGGVRVDPDSSSASGGGGGGGGSNYLADVALGGSSVPAQQQGHGTVVITWTEPPAYAFGGFQAPVDNPQTVNSGKAGRVYPVKFTVADATGAAVTSTSGITVTTRTATCGAFSSDPFDALEAEAATAAPLRYDSAGGFFILNWKTPSTAGCYKLVVTTPDGAEHPAYFQLKK